MGRLFRRNWALRINDGADELSFKDIDLEGKFTKTADTTPNELDLSVYNLNPDHRLFIHREHLAVELDVGYGGESGLLFKGGTELVNHRELEDGWLSEMHIKDGGAAAKYLTISETFKEGTDEKTIIERVLKQVKNVPPGLQGQLAELNKIAQGEIDSLGFVPRKCQKKKKKSKKQDVPVEGEKRQYLAKKQEQRAKSEQRKIQKDEILRGFALQKLRTFCASLGLTVILNNQTINIFPNGLAMTDEVIEIDASSGMIGSPEELEKGGFKITSLLRHEYNPGHLVAVESKYVKGLMIVQRIEGSFNTRGNDWYADLYCTPFDEDL